MLDRSVSTTLVMTLVLMTPAKANQHQLPPIPSYQADLASFQAEQAKAGGPKFSAQDRKIMQDAGDDLALAMPEPGLKVGATAPDFSLPNAFGKQVRLYDLLEQGPVVLTFYRGAWCPYCNLQLRGLRTALPHLEHHGAKLVAVTPQLPDKSRAQVEQEGYPFEILSDLDNRVMQAYGLFFQVPHELSKLYQDRFALDLAEYNGAGRYVLPVPGTYLIDRDGVVKLAFANTDYRIRIEPEAIVAALNNL